jgi:hypothetical protein
MAVSLIVPAISATAGIPPAASDAPSIHVSVAATVKQGSVIGLVGTWSIESPAALDYSTDAGGTWTAISNYRPFSNGTWTAPGPVASTLGSLAITVRDHDNQAVQASASTNVTT